MKNKAGKKEILSIFCTIIILFLSFATAFSASSVKASAGPSSGKDTVRIGFFESGRMFDIDDNDGTRSGYAYEYMKQVAVYAGWDYEYVYGSFSELYDMLKNGEIDILPYVNFSDKRSEEILFSEGSLSEEEYYIAYDPDNPLPPGDGASPLNGATVSTIYNAGYNDILIKYMMANGIRLNVKYYQTVDETWNALRRGEADATICTSLAYPPDDWEYFCAFGAESTFIGVAKDRRDLLEELDSSMKELAWDKRPFRGELYENYFPDNPMRSKVTQEEEDWIKEHPVLHVGGFTKDAPYVFSYDNDTHTAKGLSVDVLEGIGRRLQLDATMDFTCFDSLEEMEAALDSGEIDLIIPFYPSYYIAEQHGLIISNTVRVSNMELVYKRGKSYSEALKKVATPETRLGIYYVHDNFPNSEIVGSQSIQDAVDKVLRDEATGAIAQNIELHRIKEKYDTLDYVILSEGCGTCFAARPDDHMLIRIINRGLKYFGSSEIAAISSQYSYMEDDNYSLKDFLLDNSLIIATLIVMISMAFLLMQYANASKTKRALLVAYDEKRRNEILHDIIHSKKWSFTIDENDEIIKYDHSQDIRELINNDLEDRAYSWTDVIHPSDREAAIAAFKAAIADHSCNTPYDVIYRMIDRNGTYHWFHSAGRVMRKDDGTGEFFGIHINIDEQVAQRNSQNARLEEALSLAENASRAKSEFLFNMSHDIRTPLNAITGFTAMAKKYVDEREKVTDYLDKIDTSGQQLLALVNQVLEMARIESGQIELEEKPVNIQEEFNAIVAIMSEQAQVRGLKLSFSLENITHLNVFADDARMSSITLNIIGNAMKYTPEGGRISFKLRERQCTKPGYASFTMTVQDTGIGMSKDFLKRLFEPFSREKNSTVSRTQGTGLGLSIVKSLVDMMGGTIEVKSKPGEGTRFDITLSFRINEDVRPKTVENRETGGISFAGHRVLLVEDNELNREIARNILEEQELIVEEAVDGDVAVEMVKEVCDRGDYNYYDLIFMDIQMPRLDGYEATKAIRAIPAPEGVHIPIVAMTANAFEEDRRNAMKAGMDGHLAKPIDIQMLYKMLARFILE